MSEANPTRSINSTLTYSLDYPPPDFIDPVIEVYKKDVDRSIIRENLKLSVEERFRKYKSFLQSRAVWAGAAARSPTSETAVQAVGDTP